MHLTKKKKRFYRQQVRCPKCRHEFRTRTRAPMISCSWCTRKFKRIDNIITKKKR